MSKRKSPKSTPHHHEHQKPPSDSSPYVFQRSKLDWNLTIRERNDLTERQRALIDLILDKKTKVVFIDGPAGSTKTFIAVYCGLLMLQQRRVSHISFLRTVVESASKSLGYLPGSQEEKLSPFLAPLTQKLEEMLPAGEIKRLMAEERVVGLPVNHARGASMNAQCIILDESQNFTVKELTTALTRIGEYSKIICIGDHLQSDVNGASGFLPLFDWFNQPSFQEQGIHCVSLTKEDIKRSGILRVIVEAIEQYNASRPSSRH